MKFEAYYKNPMYFFDLKSDYYVAFFDTDFVRLRKKNEEDFSLLLNIEKFYIGLEGIFYGLQYYLLKQYMSKKMFMEDYHTFKKDKIKYSSDNKLRIMNEFRICFMRLFGL